MFSTFGLFLFGCRRRLVMRSLWFAFLVFVGAGGITAQEANMYYPLQVGNRWDYIIDSWWPPPYPGGYTDSLSVRVLGDSLLPNGKRYFVLDKLVIPGGRFVRTDSNYVYYYREGDSTDVVFYKCGASAGDKWFADIGTCPYEVTLQRVDSLTIFGQGTRVMNFRVDCLVLFEASFASGFGPVGFYSPGEPPGTSYTTWSLVGCILSGVQYGRLTAVSEGSEVPTKFSLFQNFPNPFNPSTTVRYVIPEKGTARLCIYDVLGRIVRELVDGETYPGAYETTWDGRDKQGHQVASGVYFFQLQVHSIGKPTPLVQTGKMVLMR
jgi:hypothetical protein